MSNKIRDGQRAVQAVQNKIQNKFFKEKTSISMFESDKSKDAKAKDSLKVGEFYTDSEGREWTRDKAGFIKNKANFIGKYTMPFFCPSCGRIMKGKADNKMWSLRGKCHVCVIDDEAKIKQEGKWEEYQQNIIKANAKSWLKDMEQVAKEWVEDNEKEVQQFIMNSSGELETWDVKGKKDHNLENLKKNLTNVEKQLKEKQDEM